MGPGPLYYTFIVFGVIMALIYYSKPAMMFDKNKIKSFGVGKNKTLVPLPVMAIVIAILLYSIFFYIDSINNIKINKDIITADATIQPQGVTLGQLSQHSQQQLNPQYVYRLVRTAADGSLLV